MPVLRVGVDRHTAGIDAFAPPQVEELAAERVVAQARDIAQSRAPSRAAAMTQFDVSPPNPCRYLAARRRASG